VSQPLIEPLGDCQAKLDRAREHFDELKAGINAFVQTEARPIWPELSADRTEYVVTFITRATLPLRLSTIVGEFLYNLRSCLDHMWWKLARTQGIRSDRPEFPIYDDEKSFWGNAGKFFPGMPPEAVALVVRLQPFPVRQDAQGLYHGLWLLHKLGNIDKHRLLHLINFYGIKLEYEAERLREFTTEVVTLFSSGPLKFGTELLRIRSLSGPFPADMTVYPKLIYSLALDKATTDAEIGVDLSGYLLLETLDHMLTWISEDVIPAFFRFFPGTITRQS